MAKVDLGDDTVFYAIDEALSMKSGLGLGDLVDKLPEWWGGQGDPIYKLHGLLKRGGSIDDDLASDAASNVRSTAKKLKGGEKADGMELADALDALADLINKPPKTARQRLASGDPLRAFQDVVTARKVAARFKQAKV